MFVEQLNVVWEVRVDDEAERRSRQHQADRDERPHDLAVECALLPHGHEEPEERRRAEQEDHVVCEREQEGERQEPDVLALKQKVYAKDEQDNGDAHRLAHVHAIEEGRGAADDGDEPDERVAEAAADDEPVAREDGEAGEEPRADLRAGLEVPEPCERNL